MLKTTKKGQQIHKTKLAGLFKRIAILANQRIKSDIGVSFSIRCYSLYAIKGLKI
ncbi:hypothetical protein [Listeria booriae]|uniref:hypothetical protein n=1 Tax=Listeria booriae TaxID=1552123 RepID=UPI001625D60C|nr:hypothetical protein [Listeria booriae]MBC2189957.1 hypothetical protein [Listeria booriae]